MQDRVITIEVVLFLRQLSIQSRQETISCFVVDRQCKFNYFHSRIHTGQVQITKNNGERMFILKIVGQHAP